MTINFTKKYMSLILKEIVKEISSLQRKNEKVVNQLLNEVKDGRTQKTQRHWFRVRDNEIYCREIKKLYEELKELDNQTNWSEVYRNGFFKFANKYKDVFDKYFKKYGGKKV